MSTNIVNAPPAWSSFTTLDPFEREYVSYVDENTGNVYGYGQGLQNNYQYDPITKSIYSEDNRGNRTDVSPINTGEAINNKYVKEMGYAPTDNSLQQFYDTLQSDPHQFYNTVASKLANEYFKYASGNVYGSWTDNLTNLLESIKPLDPKAYYNAQLDLLGQITGWATTNGSPETRAIHEKMIQDILPSALASGISSNEINSKLNGSFNAGAQGGSQFRSNIAASGGGGFNFGTDILPGLILVGGSALGAYGLDSALSAAAAAQTAGAVGGSAGGAAGGIGDVFAGWSPTGSLAGTAGETVGSYGAAAAGAADVGATASDITSNPVTQSMVNAANASKDPIGMMSYLTSATPEELAAATGAGAQAPLSMADALKTANQVRQVAGTANNLSKLLTQGGSTGAGAAGTALAGAAQNLATGQTGVGSAIPALIRGNQNPFLQSAQQPIRSSSDLTSLANLLKQG